MEKPDVDQIDGLSPAISIDQKGASRNPRSTVGTVTEIYDHLRLLYARIGHPHCPVCGLEISRQSVQQMAEQVMAQPDGSRLLVLGPVIRDRKGEHQGVFEQIRKSGFVRVRVNGAIHELEENIQLAKYRKHTIEVVVDRLIVRHDTGDDADAQRIRLIDSLEAALKLGGGYATVQIVDGTELHFSEHFACPEGHGSNARSRSTARTELARPAQASASQWSSTPNWSYPTRHGRSSKARSRPGRGPVAKPTPGTKHCWPRSPSASGSR
jgi:excinuclease ABC subunit A